MAWTVNSLAQKLGCAWKTVKRAIVKGELKAVWDSDRRAWLVEDGRELAFFKMRLASLHATRQQRRGRMRALWKLGRLKPRKPKRVQVQVVERWKRPTVVISGQGVFARTVGISWHGDEGSFCCPNCAAALKVR